jgi:hypothetical protein
MQNNPAAGAGRTWRRWTIWLPGLVAPAVAGALVLVDLIGMVMGSWDTPAPGLHWLTTGITGLCVLAAVAVIAAVIGMRNSPLRRAAAIAAWALMAAEIGWFVLTARLAGGT